LDSDEHPEFRKSTFGVAQKLKHIDTNKVPGPGAYQEKKVSRRFAKS